ncbi:TetR/AcrR family transcriptional regulator [Tsukamurella sp. 8F]|uniref:TetR/AcrR family transcriptional regulator n=1 Tax=unclassified Tsukamurella TaxID=2633480 RepID=UPI0023BA03FC|nr:MULTISPECIES: TetR/AcrR family transcriptional regulator [unclassified Tsukamurella]MDF0531291.1 TetR/AcrR family transcriptional regulator [Tsukamurella sp. 8J]MDF0585240.1 TetR/AcrR family transcriptional regulator [Tsukamurella sp. 8F]
MPKIVDPEARRAHIVDAVFRVVSVGGIEAATLKNVAADAGLAIGSVRHYFDSHEAILQAAAEAMAGRVGSRLLAEREAFVADPTVNRLADLLSELLPLDAERTAEVRVWLAFSAAAAARPTLARCATEMAEQTATIVRIALERAGLPSDAATVRGTVALVDGLSLAGVSAQPLPPSRIRAALDAYLIRLTTDPSTTPDP